MGNATVDVYVDYDDELNRSVTDFQSPERSIFLDKENGGIQLVDRTQDLPKTPPVPKDFAGRPNGNSKYSERKGIITHTTPFEERIERALKEQNQ